MIEAKVEGIPDLRRELAAIPGKLRKRALRVALAAGARVVRDEAQRRAPIISASAAAVLKGYRKPGTLRKAIAVRTSKIARRSGDVGVFVNVKPAKGARYKTITTKFLGLKIKGRQMVSAGQRGAKSPDDPFYWRWIEFGRRGASAKPFLQPAAAKLGQALQIFREKIGPAIAKLNNKGQTP
jgi:HK97 gp10 family phage protein